MITRFWTTLSWCFRYWADGYWPGMSLGGYRVYRGPGRQEAIDYARPVAFIGQGSPQAVLSGLGHAEGVEYWYAARAVSGAGMEEGNSHVLAYARLSNGQLQTAALLPPAEVTAQRASEDRVAVSFSYPHVPGMAIPEAFDVFGDGGDGIIDLQTPLASIDHVVGKKDFEVVVASPAFPAKFAVRSRKGLLAGPLSPIITVGAASVPEIPQPL